MGLGPPFGRPHLWPLTSARNSVLRRSTHYIWQAAAALAEEEAQQLAISPQPWLGMWMVESREDDKCVLQ